MKEKKRLNNQKVESMISCAKEKKLLVAYEIAKNDIVNIGLHFILKNVRPYAAPCSEA